MAEQEKNQEHSNTFPEVLDSLATALSSSGLMVRSPILTFAYPASPEICSGLKRGWPCKDWKDCSLKFKKKKKCRVLEVFGGGELNCVIWSLSCQHEATLSL